MQTKVTHIHKGYKFIATRDGATVTITRDTHAAGAWRWDDEEGIQPVGPYVHLLPLTDDSEDVLYELAQLIRAAARPQ